MGVQDWLDASVVLSNLNYTVKIRPRAKCAGGLAMSIQASSYHYCTPRVDNSHFYTHVEIGFPSSVVEELLSYAECKDTPTRTVYPYVPVDLLESVVKAHGGIVL
jgi:hypothetical protein